MAWPLPGQAPGARGADRGWQYRRVASRSLLWPGGMVAPTQKSENVCDDVWCCCCCRCCCESEPYDPRLRQYTPEWVYLFSGHTEPTDVRALPLAVPVSTHAGDAAPLAQVIPARVGGGAPLVWSCAGCGYINEGGSKRGCARCALPHHQYHPGRQTRNNDTSSSGSTTTVDGGGGDGGGGDGGGGD